MNDPNQMPDIEPEEEDVEDEVLDEQWEARAWLYTIWVVIGQRIYCKIGYSTNPLSRYNQLISGIPERPFALDLVACLNVEQAQIFEGLLHEHLARYRARGEWFTHHNAKHFVRVLVRKLHEILALFRTFGYEPYMEHTRLSGDRPVNSQDGHISYLAGSEEADEEEEA